MHQVDHHLILTMKVKWDYYYYCYGGVDGDTNLMVIMEMEIVSMTDYIKSSSACFPSSLCEKRLAVVVVVVVVSIKYIQRFLCVYVILCIPNNTTTLLLYCSCTKISSFLSPCTVIFVLLVFFSSTSKQRRGSVSILVLKRNSTRFKTTAHTFLYTQTLSITTTINAAHTQPNFKFCILEPSSWFW